ncbi:hypothetical protein C0Q70_12812 [Pomacea canaliculata]|uniref:ERAP1-like C-terminal domain-containing protein n=1 Tax=Pomacea canaliculata TaxID=400727 RepID=A0A2T7P2I7_POMCA|nr:hypothetical protein C0Q70_12812 [Pomacea canaliculata]
MDQFLVKTFRQAMLQDSTETSVPLHRKVDSKQDILSAYNSIIYVKKYLHAFQYSTATQKDLWETLMTEAEKDGIHLNLSDIMESWTVQNNYPVVMVTRLRAGEISVSQQRYLLEPKENSSRSHAWDIPFTFVTSTSPHATADPSPSDVIWLRRQVLEEHIVRETIAAPDDEEQWILGNVGCYGFYRVNYDDIGWRALISQLNKDNQKIPTANRVQIISDSWNLAKAGLLNYSTALCTLEYLHNETSYLPWEAAVSELEDLLKMLSPDDKAFNLLTENTNASSEDRLLVRPTFVRFHGDGRVLQVDGGTTQYNSGNASGVPVHGDSARDRERMELCLFAIQSRKNRQTTRTTAVGPRLLQEHNDAQSTEQMGIKSGKIPRTGNYRYSPFIIFHSLRIRYCLEADER